MRDMVTRRPLSTSKWYKWRKGIDNRNAKTVGVIQERKVTTSGQISAQITEGNRKGNEKVNEVKASEEIIMRTEKEATEREGEVKAPETTLRVRTNMLESARKRSPR